MKASFKTFRIVPNVKENIFHSARDLLFILTKFFDYVDDQSRRRELCCFGKYGFGRLCSRFSQFCGGGRDLNLALDG